MKFKYNSPPRKLFEVDIPEGFDFLLERQPNFKYAELDFALKYSQPYVQSLIQSIPYENTRKHIVLDIKKIYLQKGQLPCLPGWHTDCTLNPLHETRPEAHYILISGCGSKTKFLNQSLEIELQEDMFKSINDAMTKEVNVLEIEEDTFYSYDRFSIHAPSPAEYEGLRFIIRLTETDLIKPIRKFYEI